MRGAMDRLENATQRRAFENQSRFSPAFFPELAEELGLNPSELGDALAKGLIRLMSARIS